MDILVFFKGLEILDITVRAPIASMIDVVPSMLYGHIMQFGTLRKS